MSDFAPFPPRVNRVAGLGLLVALLILSIFFSACSTESEPAKEPYVSEDGSTFINDLKLSFMLPDGWWQNGEPVRSTAVDPESKRGNREQLQSAMHMYISHNLQAYQDSLLENPAEDLRFQMLTLSVHTYYNESQLTAWAEGKCGQEKFCDEAKPPANLRLIRELKAEENPFSEGTGVLYMVTGSAIPVVAYIYYLVRDGWAYRISHEVSVYEIAGWPYPPLLDSITFME